MRRVRRYVQRGWQRLLGMPSRQSADCRLRRVDLHDVRIVGGQSLQRRRLCVRHLSSGQRGRCGTVDVQQLRVRFAQRRWVDVHELCAWIAPA